MPIDNPTVGDHIIVRKTADESVVDSDVAQNDDHLFFAVGVNDVWDIKLYLYHRATAVRDIRFNLAVPVGGAGFWWRYGVLGTFTGGRDPISPLLITTGLAFNGADADRLGIILCRYVGGGVAGNVQLQWSNESPGVGTSTVYANSYLIAHKVR